ncbi:hypothetical protein AN690_0218135 [Citrobacter freundii]|nr:hypothetical protein D3H39_13300 [Citrobacter portucalensis]OCO59297.1 hypothetical protein AN688_0221785 [Citrobacter freundii]OEH22327.1 hypothetical protein AN690_0218135 [Citrobacter freundii]
MNHDIALLLTMASMMPASAALAIIVARICNECNKIAIIYSECRPDKRSASGIDCRMAAQAPYPAYVP